MEKYDPSKIKAVNSRDLNHLHPLVKQFAIKFLEEVNKIAKPLGAEVKVVSTLRTWAEQDALYAQGRTKPGKIVTNARAGKSMHNWGVAFDIGVFKGGVYNPKELDYLFDRFGPIGQKMGLEWGGAWTSIKDRPHYQYTGTLSNSQFLNSVSLNNLDDLLDYKKYNTIEELLKDLKLM